MRLFTRRGPGLNAGLTTRARCLLAAGLAAIVSGLALGEVDLIRAGVLAIALPVVAAVVVRRSQVSIASRRSVEPAQVPAGASATMTLVVTNRSVLPTGPLMMEDQLPARLAGRARFVLDGLTSRGSRSVTYRIPGLTRGGYTVGPLRLRLTDPFGMVDLTRSFAATSSFTVRPVVEPLPGYALPRSWDAGENAGSHSIGTHGADDASTREYRQGDDLRKIHWRSSARTGALMVRHEERPWQGHAALLLDVRAGAHLAARDESVEPRSSDPRSSEHRSADPRRADSLEWAVSFAASVGMHLLRNGRQVTLLTSGAGNRYASAGAGRFLDELAVLPRSRARDLSALAEPVRAVGRDTTMVAVLGQLDATSLRVLTDAHPRGAGTTAFAVLIDATRWGFGESDGRWLAAAQVLRSSGWWVVPAGPADSAAEIWTALLAQRPGGVAAPLPCGEIR